MGIEITDIPLDFRPPGQYFQIDNRLGGSTSSTLYKRILLIGQKLSTGTGDALTPTLFSNPAQVEGECGVGSQLAAMAKALKKANSITESWFVALEDDAAGVKATKTLTFTGPATSAGTLALYVGGELIRVGVQSGDTATAIATAVAAAVVAKPQNPFAATSSAAVVTLTCRHKGSWGNDLDVRFNYRTGEALPDGVGVTVAAGATGTANPLVEDALAALGANWFTHIVVPYNDDTNLDALNAALEDNWTATIMKDSVYFTAKRGSLSTVSTFGTTRNDKLGCCIDAATSPTPPYIWAVDAAAVDAAEPIPNRPRHTLILPNCLPPAHGEERTLAEENILLHDGISTHRVARDGTVSIGQLVTMYQTSVWGVADDSYLHVSSIELLAYLRYDIRRRTGQKWPRVRIVPNGSHVQSGPDLITLGDIDNEIFAWAQDMIEAGYIWDDMPAFKAAYRSEISANDNSRVNLLIPPKLVKGLEVIAGLIEFRN